MSATLCPAVGRELVDLTADFYDLVTSEDNFTVPLLAAGVAALLL